MTLLLFALYREIVTLPDGGEIALDWSKQKKDDSATLQQKPVMLIVPGITGIYISIVCT